MLLIVTGSKFSNNILTITSWIYNTATPQSIILTSPGGASSESVASVTGVGGHSVHWSQTISPHIVGEKSIGQKR